MSDKIAPPPLSTLHKGLNILEYIAKSDRLVRLRDVAEAFSMDRSTALRFLKTLQSTGFIDKYEELKAYSITAKLVELYQPQPKLEQLIDRIKPYLVKLAQTTKQSAHLGILQDKSATLVGVETSPGRIAVKQAVGDLEPLYSSAVGKAIYSFLPDHERIQLAQNLSFKKQTKHTIQTIEALEIEAAIIQNTGVAFDNKEISTEICCIACPIFDKARRPIASIGISMIAALLEGSLSEQQALIAAVTNIAEEVQVAEINL